MGNLGPEMDGNPSLWWEICCIFWCHFNCHSWLLCCLFWPPTTPKQSTTSLMMFGDAVALSMKEEGHQWGWCALWWRWSKSTMVASAIFEGVHDEFIIPLPILPPQTHLLMENEGCGAFKYSLNHDNFGGCNNNVEQASMEGVDLEAPGSIPCGWGHPMR